jgi:hypothetical protein
MLALFARCFSIRILRTSFAFFTFVCLFEMVSPCDAALIGYKFDGTVSIISPTNAIPFGVVAASTPPATPVTGRFFYDTLSAGVVNAGSATYQQSISNGFSATINGKLISTDSYVVSVDDRTGSAFDTFAVYFSSFGSPTPISPLIVDGTPFTTGRFSLALNGSSNVFSSPELPMALNSATFSIKNGMLTESSTFVGIFFNITSLVPIPEPSAAVLSFGGAFVLFRFTRRRRHSLR